MSLPALYAPTSSIAPPHLDSTEIGHSHARARLSRRASEVAAGMPHQQQSQQKGVLKLYAKLIPTGEKFLIHSIRPENTIEQLKANIEYDAGLPVNLQKLSYLDDELFYCMLFVLADLIDHTTVKQNDIISGATLRLDTWVIWKELVEAVAADDLEWVISLGVGTSQSSGATFKSAALNYMLPRQRAEFLQRRANVALFVAAHRGHLRLAEHLLRLGADVNATTPLGRTPLHVAVAGNHGDLIDVLLHSGAQVDAEDEEGETPMDVAVRYGHKKCERHLFMWQWQQRARRVGKRPESPPPWPHQKFDSNLPPLWLTNGPAAQTYIVNLDNCTEFAGSRLNAPRRKPKPPEAFREHIKPRKRYGRVQWGPDVPIEVPKPPRRSASKRFVGLLKKFEQPVPVAKQDEIDEWREPSPFGDRVGSASEQVSGAGTGSESHRSGGQTPTRSRPPTGSGEAVAVAFAGARRERRAASGTRRVAASAPDDTEARVKAVLERERLRLEKENPLARAPDARNDDDYDRLVHHFCDRRCRSAHSAHTQRSDHLE